MQESIQHNHQCEIDLRSPQERAQELYDTLTTEQKILFRKAFLTQYSHDRILDRPWSIMECLDTIVAIHQNEFMPKD